MSYRRAYGEGEQVEADAACHLRASCNNARSEGRTSAHARSAGDWEGGPTLPVNVDKLIIFL